MWFGTGAGGVCMFDGKSITTYTEEEGLSGDIVLSIFKDSKGDLWFGSYGMGVTRCRLTKNKDSKVASFTNYSVEDGLGNNSISSIS